MLLSTINLQHGIEFGNSQVALIGLKNIGLLFFLQTGYADGAMLVRHCLKCVAT